MGSYDEALPAWNGKGKCRIAIFLRASSDLQELEKQPSRSYASMLSQNAAMSGWGRSGVEAVCGTYNVARKNG